MPDETRTLPEYAKTQRAFHRAFGRELVGAIRASTLPRRGRVLDLPAGDGFYTLALARRLHGRGEVVAADLSPAYLAKAKERVAGRGRLAPVEFRQADAYELPFADDSFDGVWCAESLITLTEPVRALTEMRRVLRPGGSVVVLEADEFHHVVLNWPVALELAVLQAVATATRERTGSSAGLSPSRKVRGWMQQAGLTLGPKRTIAADRQAPFSPAVERFLRRRLAETRATVRPHLDPAMLAVFDEATHESAPGSIFTRPDAELICLTSVFSARK